MSESSAFDFSDPLVAIGEVAKEDDGGHKHSVGAVESVGFILLIKLDFGIVDILGGISWLETGFELLGLDIRSDSAAIFLNGRPIVIVFHQFLAGAKHCPTYLYQNSKYKSSYFTCLLIPSKMPRCYGCSFPT